jgi:hypothetical protein
MPDEITIHSEILNAPHSTSVEHLCGWLNSRKAMHQPTHKMPEPSVQVSEYGVRVTWTTHGYEA